MLLHAGPEIRSSCVFLAYTCALLLAVVGAWTQLLKVANFVNSSHSVPQIYHHLLQHLPVALRSNWVLVLIYSATAVVGLGLLYENMILFIGNFLGTGGWLLRRLSWGRYYFHVLAPSLVLPGVGGYITVVRGGSSRSTTDPMWSHKKELQIAI